MNEKLHIEKNTIQETLIIPLYARKLCTELYPSLFTDTGAEKLMAKLDYDFSAIEKQSKSFVQRYGAFEVAMRQTDLQIEIKDYLKAHPKAAVVNMGCGLDETGESCYNSQCKIYNIDMPDIIKIRNELIPPAENVTNIACDLNDTDDWFNKIDDSDGSVFFAAGVFYYLEIDAVKVLINKMAERFKKGKLCFDTGNETALKLMMKTVIKQAGIQNISAFFHVDDIDKDVRAWLKNAVVSEKGYMTGYNDLTDKYISKTFRLLSKIGDKKMRLRIIRFDFN